MSDQEPKHISDIPGGIEGSMDFTGDPERDAMITERDLGYEIQGLEEDRANLITEIESGNDTEENRERLAKLNQALLSAQSDLNIHRVNPGGNP